MLPDDLIPTLYIFTVNHPKVSDISPHICDNLLHVFGHVSSSQVVVVFILYANSAHAVPGAVCWWSVGLTVCCGICVTILWIVKVIPTDTDT